MIVCLTALLLALPMLATAVAAADDWTVSVRIVGLGEDIYNAEVSVAEGASAGDALAAVEGVEIVGLDSYITEVDGIAAGMFGGWDGWNYRVNGKSPSVGMRLRTATPFCSTTGCSICKSPRSRMRTAF